MHNAILVESNALYVPLPIWELMVLVLLLAHPCANLRNRHPCASQSPHGSTWDCSEISTKLSPIPGAAQSLTRMPLLGDHASQVRNSHMGLLAASMRQAGNPN
jgi:hypothetical protein